MLSAANISSLHEILCCWYTEMCWLQERLSGDVARYNDIIQHETLRVAVVGMIENDYGVTMPEPLHEAMEKSFLQFYEFYESVAQRKMHLNGQNMQVCY